jgi:3-deoxy-D-manno-octulosonic-acid transferase
MGESMAKSIFDGRFVRELPDRARTACENNDLGTASLLLRRIRAMRHDMRNRMMTVFYHACSYGRPHIVRWVIEALQEEGMRPTLTELTRGQDLAADCDAHEAAYHLAAYVAPILDGNVVDARARILARG